MASLKPATRKRLRRNASLVLTLCVGIMAISGVVLFFSPRGAIARDMGWTFVGLGKFHWMAIHNTMAWLLLGTVILHVALSWHTFAAYFKRLTSGVVWETALALAVVALLVMGAAAGWQPFAALSGNTLDRAHPARRHDGRGHGWGRGRGRGRGRGHGWHGWGQRVSNDRTRASAPVAPYRSTTHNAP